MPIGDWLVWLSGGVIALGRWLWAGQTGPAVDFLAVLLGAYIAFRQGRRLWREQQVEERAERERAEQQALVHLLMAVADEGENARHLLDQIAQTTAEGCPEMAEIPIATLETAVSSPLIYQTPTSTQVAMRAYLSAARTVRNMLEGRRLTFAATRKDWSETHLSDLKVAVLRAARLLSVMRREMEKQAPRYGVRRELDPDFKAVTEDIAAINLDQPLPARPTGGGLPSRGPDPDPRLRGSTAVQDGQTSR